MDSNFLCGIKEIQENTAAGIIRILICNIEKYPISAII